METFHLCNADFWGDACDGLRWPAMPPKASELQENVSFALSCGRNFILSHISCLSYNLIIIQITFE